ncbi:hypothetical protein RRG08_013189 [Elysia crispata]|uniref:Uncharacterized protein n=1 Tax=Elysia crispata TaxID=231223 RepID=A0AAE1B4S0_9GAST|nr:hypothetical protein RRG08_013189 [Elysia crispata]
MPHLGLPGSAHSMQPVIKRPTASATSSTSYSTIRVTEWGHRGIHTEPGFHSLSLLLRTNEQAHIYAGRLGHGKR